MQMRCGVCSWAGDLAVQHEPRIAWCPTCRTGLTVPPPARDVSSDAVFTAPGSYADRMADQGQWRAEASARVQWLREVVAPPHSILELGSATGEFVEAAERSGYDIVGVEPSRWAADQARTVTTAVFVGDLEEYRTRHPDRRFSAVVLFHTLEHVSDPRGLLLEVREVLEPGAAVLIEVPNAGTQRLTSDGRSWWMRSLDDHVHHFRPDGLRRLLADCGYLADVRQQTLRSAYGGRRSSLHDRLRALVRERRARDAPDLLRAVARCDG